MLVTPMAIHEQWNASVVLGKTVVSVKITRSVKIIIKHVLFSTFLTVIKHAREHASFCNTSKAYTPGLATEGDVTS